MSWFNAVGDEGKGQLVTVFRQRAEVEPPVRTPQPAMLRLGKSGNAFHF
jgi:hypothetical protein